MTVECQYKDGKWKRFRFRRIELMETSFRVDEDRPVKIKVPDGLTVKELAYLIRYVDFRSSNKIIQD